MVAVVDRLRRATSSKEEFLRFVQTKEHPEEGTAYFNEDLLPTPLGTYSANLPTIQVVGICFGISTSVSQY